MSNLVNKVVDANGVVYLDMEADTVAPENVAKGVTFHDSTGAAKTGTSTKDLDTSGATIKPAEALNGTTFGARGSMMIGTMPNRGEMHLDVDSTGRVKIPNGHHDGAGDAGLSKEDLAALSPENVREGVEYLGKTGKLKVGAAEVP